MTVDLGPGSEFGPYRVESVLGRGGMSVVYLAEDTRLGRRVAIKVLAPELAADASFRSRFVRESQLAAGLEHPNIVPVHEAGETDGQLFIAMRYVRGTDLRTLIVREGPLDPERTIALLRPVAAALDVAHRRGLVHRDVKPGNILIASDEGEEHVYLSDFGLTKHTTSRSGLTRTGQFMGTVDYVAPEQIQGQEVDGRADEYSLACVLFECLTATVPFAKDSDVATLFGHIQDPPPTVTGPMPDLPGEIDEVIRRGMAKDRDGRPSTCTVLIADAARALGAPSGPREAPSVPPAPSVGTAPPFPLGPPAPGPAPPASYPPVESGPVAPVPIAAEPPVPSFAAEPPVPPSGGGRSGNSRVIALLGAAGVAIAAILVVVGLSLSGDGDEPPSPTGATGTTNATGTTGSTGSTGEGPPPPPTVVSNTSPIAIAESGGAGPYPSEIEVSGVDDPITDVNVTLEAFGHGYPDDVDLLLVAPSGDAVVLMADAGGSSANEVAGLTLTFDDEASAPLPDDGLLSSGSFRPTTGTDLGGGTCCDFAGNAPAPPPPYGTELSVLDGTDANGTWQLFVFDDTATDKGKVAGGWSLEIDVAPATGGDGSPTPPPTGPTGVIEPAVFTGPEAIDVPDSGQASPYPSVIEVSGLSGTIADVKVTLSGVTHDFPSDLDVLLVGPTGASVVLLADRGTSEAVNGITLTFDDAASSLPPVDSALVTGSFRPERGARCCSFAGDAPAPPPPYGATLTVFDGTDPNGTWSLFVYDDAGGDAGTISGGWSLEITPS